MCLSRTVLTDQMDAETLKLWLMSSPVDPPHPTSPLQSEPRDEFKVTPPSGTPTTYQTYAPFINGVDRIKSEPIDGHNNRKMFNGNNRSPGRRQLIDPPLQGADMTDSAVASTNVCPICGKWFRSRQQVSQHLLVHTDERRYKCAYCDRAFKQASHLQQHHRIHTGEKPYRCPLPGCSRAFPQLSNLNHHLRNHDKPDPPLSNTCVYCQRVYASQTVLRSHMQKIHLKNAPSTPNSPADVTKPNDCENKTNYKVYETTNKLASSPMASMTVAPPVFNFNQPFLTPYVHDLNYVQLSAKTLKYPSIPTDSKMTLPISLPNKHGDGSHEVARSRPNDTSDSAPRESDEETKQNGAIHYSNQPSENEDQERSFDRTFSKRTKMVSMNGEVYPRGMVSNGLSVHQHEVNIEEDKELHCDKENDPNDSDGDRHEGFETADKDKSAVEYSYTLDGVVDNTNANLVSLNETNQSNVNGNEITDRSMSPNPWASSDDILRARIVKSTHDDEANTRLEDYLNQIDQLVHSTINDPHVNIEKNSISRNQRPSNEQLLRSYIFAPLNSTEVKTRVFDYRNPSDNLLRSKMCFPHREEGEIRITTSDSTRISPVTSDSGVYEETSANTLIDTIVPSSVDTEVREAWMRNISPRDDLVAFDKGMAGAVSNGHDLAQESRELQRHSRKRKAFRPQRVIHDNVVIQDNDV